MVYSKLITKPVLCWDSTKINWKNIFTVLDSTRHNITAHNASGLEIDSPTVPVTMATVEIYLGMIGILCQGSNQDGPKATLSV